MNEREMEDAASSSSSSAAAAAAASSASAAPAPARELLAASTQQLNLLQQQLEAQFVDRVEVIDVAGELAAEFNGGGDLFEHFYDVPGSSRSVDLGAAQDAQSSEAPSWFESSVEDLLQSIQPSFPANSGRASLDSSADVQLSAGQGGDTLSISKRHKVLGFSTHGLKACCRSGQNAATGTASASSSLGPCQIVGPQMDVSASLPADREGSQQEAGSSGEEDIIPQSAMESDAPSMYLTDDLLHMVFSFLDQRTLCEAARVCRQWHTASEHEDFWKSLHFGSNITQEQVSGLCRRFPRAVDVKFSHVSLVDEVAREAMHSLRYLEKLSVFKGTLNDAFFVSLANGCPLLNHLVIIDVVLGSVGSQEVQIRHKNLSRLKVQECRVMRIGIRCPRLEELSLRQTNMASAILQCPRLRSLDVSSCLKLSDAGVRLAATSCRMLLALNISQCSYVSDETLREICLACGDLQVLDASWCPNISLQGVRMPALRELRLNNCEGINSSSMAALSQCYTLEAVALDACVLLTAVTLGLQRLNKIRLACCYKLVDLTLQCPALVEVDVTDCAALTRFDVSSLALRSLSLYKQPSLTTLALDCPHLQVVSLVECDLLANSICDVLSDRGGCPRLGSLTVESCESLSVLVLSSTTLSTLSLAGCHNLREVNLACPSLQQLFLDGCHQLSSVVLAPVGLQSLNLGICPHVTNLKLDAARMVSVDLKGCGSLNKANIMCPQLVSLDASYCSSLDDKCLEAATMACPLIQSLILACCPLIGPAGLLTLKKLGNLTTLDLSYTFLMDLSPIFESCKRLKILRLLACKYLGDSALDALQYKDTLPELRELDLSYGGLGHSSLKGVLSKCTYLTHVDLNGCAKLGDLVWDIDDSKTSWSLPSGASIQPESYGNICGESVHVGVEDGRLHALQQLNCVGCPNVKKVVIVEATGFRDLYTLNFSLSTNLKEAYIECPFLATLNLSHCTALELIQLNCPRLVSLSLQASGIQGRGLEAVLQGCTALETLDMRSCSKISTEDVMAIRAACPRLKRLLSSSSPCQ